MRPQIPMPRRAFSATRGLLAIRCTPNATLKMQFAQLSGHANERTARYRHDLPGSGWKHWLLLVPRHTTLSPSNRRALRNGRLSHDESLGARTHRGAIAFLNPCVAFQCSVIHTFHSRARPATSPESTCFGLRLSPLRHRIVAGTIELPQAIE